MATITKIAIHHTGGRLGEFFWPSSHLTAEDINKAHKERWGFQDPITKLYGGYNFFYEKDGKRTQFRAIGNETAAQKGHNFDAISLCFAGNLIRKQNGEFVDKPSAEILVRATNDIVAIIEGRAEQAGMVLAPDTKIAIDYKLIQPHYYFQPTECYGQFLPPNWGKDIAIQNLNLKISLFKQILELIQQKIRIMSLINNLKGLDNITPCWMSNQRG